MRVTKLLVALFLCCFCTGLSAQVADSAKPVLNFSGNASITNNGISLVPSFSLNKPAALFNMSLGGKRLSFDPEFNFSLAGKPWYFLFWLRYKLVDQKRFKMTAGTHLGLNFKDAVLVTNGDSAKAMLTERYIVAELAPNYALTNHTTVGVYFLHSRGLDPSSLKRGTFLTLNANFHDLRVAGPYLLKIVPQVFYLRQYKEEGYYATAAFTLSREHFPLSLSSVVNHSIQTEIEAGKGFVWNLSLNWSFRKQYLAKK